MSKEKPKTRWGCLIAALVVVIILAGGGYLFYTLIYPQILKSTQPQSTYSPPSINKEDKEKAQGNKDYGEPIKDNESVGRADPFAPI